MTAAPTTPGRWLTVKSAAAYLDFPSPESFYKWSRRNDISFAHRGRILIFWSADLEAALDKHGAQQSSRGAA